MSDWVVFHSLFSQRRRFPAFLWYCHNVGYSPLRREFVSLQVSPDNDFRISSSSPSSSFLSSHARESFSSTFQNTRLKNSELIHLPRRLRMYFVLDDSYENDVRIPISFVDEDGLWLLVELVARKGDKRLGEVGVKKTVLFVSSFFRSHPCLRD